MGISTSTGTLTTGQSRTFNLSPASAVTLTLSPNVRVTITETPATVAATGLGGNASRVHEPRLPGTFTYGPYPMGGVVVVAVASNSGSSVAWTRKDTVVTTSSDGTSLVSGDGVLSWVQGYWGPYKLRRSLAKIGQAYARQASIGVFGHSVVAGAYANDVVSTVSPADRTWNSLGWVGVMRRVLAARYGTASVGGLLHPAENFSTNFTVGGGAAQAGPNLSAGLAGYRINLAAAADTVSVTGTGRYLRIWGYALTAGLKARYTIDGGSLTTDPGAGSATATPSGSQYWYTFDIDCTTDAEHTVVLQGAASGSWYFWGAAFLAQTTSGVLVHRMGRSSAVLPDIVAVSLDATDTAGPAWRTTLNDVNKTQQLEAITTRLGLDLAICMVDANDVSGGWMTYGYTLADIRRHAQNFADRVTALDIDVLFVTGPQRDPAAYAIGVPFTQDEAIAQYAAVAAATDRVAHIDLSVTYPTFALADADDLLIDIVHPNSRGHGWIGSRIGQALLAAV